MTSADTRAEEKKKRRVEGKMCGVCGRPGKVLYETERRIVYECPLGHQYETRKRL